MSSGDSVSTREVAAYPSSEAMEKVFFVYFFSRSLASGVLYGLLILMNYFRNLLEYILFFADKGRSSVD